MARISYFLVDSMWVRFVVNWNQAELDWTVPRGRKRSRVCQIQRSYSLSAAALTHRPRNSASIFESASAEARRERIGRGGGGGEEDGGGGREEEEGKTPASRLHLAIKNSIVLWSRSLSSDVCAMKFNCEKSLSEAAVSLAGESWGL